MSARHLSFSTLAPEAYRALASVKGVLEQSSLGKQLIELINLRVSQINGCAYCVDMHARELLQHDEQMQRINSLVTWRETDFFSERERAALAWAEAVTGVNRQHPSDELLDALKQHFSDKEIVELGFVVATMNAWNRIAIGFHAPVKKAPLAA